jgi:hypothetical protein
MRSTSQFGVGTDISRRARRSAARVAKVSLRHLDLSTRTGAYAAYERTKQPPLSHRNVADSVRRIKALAALEK